jgi:hypothetical protein
MSVELEYRSPSTDHRDHEGTLYRILLKSACGYLLLSSVTIPFSNAIWVGELPLLALVQVPKVSLANWLRHLMVMHVLVPIGLSRGSYSPNWTLARPAALAVAYVMPLILLLGVVLWRRGAGKSWRKWLLLVMVLAVVDYFMTLAFASTRALTLY